MILMRMMMLVETQNIITHKALHAQLRECSVHLPVIIVPLKWIVKTTCFHSWLMEWVPYFFWIDGHFSSDDEYDFVPYKKQSQLRFVIQG